MTDPQSTERRKLRSDVPYRAAELYLESRLRRDDVHAVAVSDRQGLPIVGVGTADEVEVLSVWGALSVPEKARYVGELRAVCPEIDCVTRPLRIGDAILHVTCTIDRDADDPRLDEALKRIFAAPDPGAS